MVLPGIGLARAEKCGAGPRGPAAEQRERSEQEGEESDHQGRELGGLKSGRSWPWRSQIANEGDERRLTPWKEPSG